MAGEKSTCDGCASVEGVSFSEHELLAVAAAVRVHLHARCPLIERQRTGRRAGSLREEEDGRPPAVPRTEQKDCGTVGPWDLPADRAALPPTGGKAEE